MSTSSPRGCSALSFGYVCLTTAIIFGVTGVLWHFPRVTRTDGIIVESVAVAGAQNKRLITYEYTAYGARHRGQRLLGWGRSIPPGFFDVGQSFPVYFDTDKPDFSYAPYPPEKTIFIVSAITFAVLGLVLFCLDRACDKLRIDEFNGSGSR